MPPRRDIFRDRASGPWFAFRFIGGRWVRKSTKCSQRSAALIVAHRWREEGQQIIAGVLKESDRSASDPISKHIDAYLVFLSERPKPAKARHVAAVGRELRLYANKCGWIKLSGMSEADAIALAESRRVGKKRKNGLSAMHFVRSLWAFPIEHLAIENPIGVLSTFWRQPTQIIQPWQFGDDASKATCLWLRGLPELCPAGELPGGRTARRANQTESGQNRLGPSPTRKRDRSMTYQGIADAMAQQWGDFILKQRQAAA